MRWLLLSVACLSACTGNYEHINTPPYDATEEDMTADDYKIQGALTSMQGWVVPFAEHDFQFVDVLLGATLGGYLAEHKGWTEKISTYNPTYDWTEVAFKNIVSGIFIAHTQLRGATDDPVPLAVAEIVKVAALHRVTDIYGPIPYSQVGHNGELTAPYDAQKSIYEQMFAALDKAVATLTAHRAEAPQPEGRPDLRGRSHGLDPLCQFAQAATGRAYGLRRPGGCAPTRRGGRAARGRRDDRQRPQRHGGPSRAEPLFLAHAAVGRLPCCGRHRLLHERIRRSAPRTLLRPFDLHGGRRRRHRQRLLRSAPGHQGLRCVAGCRLLEHVGRQDDPHAVDERRRGGLPACRGGVARLEHGRRCADALRAGHRPLVRRVGRGESRGLCRRNVQAGRLRRSEAGLQRLGDEHRRRALRCRRRLRAQPRAHRHPEVDRLLAHDGGRGVVRVPPHGLSAPVAVAAQPKRRGDRAQCLRPAHGVPAGRVRQESGPLPRGGRHVARGPDDMATRVWWDCNPNTKNR